MTATWEWGTSVGELNHFLQIKSQFFSLILALVASLYLPYIRMTTVWLSCVLFWWSVLSVVLTGNVELLQIKSAKEQILCRMTLLLNIVGGMQAWLRLLSLCFILLMHGQIVIILYAMHLLTRSKWAQVNSFSALSECCAVISAPVQAGLKVGRTARVWVSMPSTVCARYVARNGFVRSSSRSLTTCLPSTFCLIKCSQIARWLSQILCH